MVASSASASAGSGVRSMAGGANASCNLNSNGASRAARVTAVRDSVTARRGRNISVAWIPFADGKAAGRAANVACKAAKSPPFAASRARSNCSTTRAMAGTREREAAPDRLSLKRSIIQFVGGGPRSGGTRSK